MLTLESKPSFCSRPEWLERSQWMLTCAAERTWHVIAVSNAGSFLTKTRVDEILNLTAEGVIYLFFVLSSTWYSFFSLLFFVYNFCVKCLLFVSFRRSQRSWTGDSRLRGSVSGTPSLLKRKRTRLLAPTVPPRACFKGPTWHSCISVRQATKEPNNRKNEAKEQTKVADKGEPTLAQTSRQPHTKKTSKQTHLTNIARVGKRTKEASNKWNRTNRRSSSSSSSSRR